MISYSLWSMLYSVLIGSLMILMFHWIILNSKHLTRCKGVTSLFLLLLVFFRIVLPIDSDLFIVIRSTRILTKLNDILSKNLYQDITVETGAIFLWIIGALILLLRWVKILIKDINKTNFIKRNSKHIPKQYVGYLQEVGINHNRVVISDFVDEVITIGIIDYMVVLPNVDYTYKDIVNIMLHEASHIEHKDILIKIVLHVFSCIFWWNPVFKVVENDYATIIEYRCDDNAVNYYDENERIDYVKTLKKMALIKLNSENKFMEVNFSNAPKESILIARARRILENNFPKGHHDIAFILLGCLLFALSYMFILQPFYSPDSDSIKNEIKIERNTSYLIKEGEEFKLYVNGEDWGLIKNEELGMKPYCELEIVE